jgi:hypothetical protein
VSRQPARLGGPRRASILAGRLPRHRGTGQVVLATPQADASDADLVTTVTADGDDLAALAPERTHDHGITDRQGHQGII